MATIRCRRCVGVELSRERHNMAKVARARLRQLLTHLQRPGGPGAPSWASAAAGVEFLCQDMRELTYSDATFVYLMNQDIPRAVVDAVFDTLRKLNRRVRVLTLCRVRGAGEPARVFQTQQSWTTNPIDAFLYDISKPAVECDEPTTGVGPNATPQAEPESAEPEGHKNTQVGGVTGGVGAER